MLRSLKAKLERWLGLDMPTIRIEGETLYLGYPDPMAVARRKTILKAATNPLAVGIVSTVIAGIILKLLGAV